MTIGNRKLVVVDSTAIAEQQEVASEALALPDQARAFKIEDSDTLAKANEFFLACHAMEKKIEKTFDPICKAANAAHKTATKAKADALKPVSEAKGIVRKEMEAYNEAQEDIRKERERQAQEEERRKAETAQLERAAALEAQGHKELAEQVLEAPIVVPQVTLPTVKSEVQGATFIEVWKYKVTDPKALLQAAVDGKIAFKIEDAEEEKTTGAVKVSLEVGKLVSALKGECTLPGISVWMTKDLRASGR